MFNSVLPLLSIPDCVGGEGDSVGVAIDVALAGADKIMAGIDKFNSGAASNECKFSITHHGKSGHNGFRTEK